MRTTRLWIVIPLGLTACPPPLPEDTDRDTQTTVTWQNPAEAVDTHEDEHIVQVAMTAAPATLTIRGESIEGYAYNDQVPGPTIRAKRGDVLRVDLTNNLDVPTTIHWHGMHVPYSMDGVTWSTDPIQPGESFMYAFELNQVGTYWYHPHFDTNRQVDLGLYGMLIVEEADEPTVDEEIVMVFDSWGEYQDADAEGHKHDSVGTIDTWTVSGQHGVRPRVDAGSVVRGRLLNASSTGYLQLNSEGMRQIGSDQGFLPSLQQPDTLLLAPGDRADVMWLTSGDDIVLTQTPYSLAGGSTFKTPIDVFGIEVIGETEAPPSPAWPFAGGVVSTDPSHTDIVYVFQGDGSSGVWMINGEVFPDVTVEEVPLDSEVILEIRNLSASEHPFHLHGHAFEVLSIDGVPPAIRTLEDTVNVGIRQTLRIRLLANNPGSWMTHCHILPHADGGMMTVLQVNE